MLLRLPESRGGAWLCKPGGSPVVALQHLSGGGLERLHWLVAVEADRDVGQMVLEGFDPRSVGRALVRHRVICNASRLTPRLEAALFRVLSRLPEPAETADPYLLRFIHRDFGLIEIYDPTWRAGRDVQVRRVETGEWMQMSVAALLAAIADRG